MPIPIRDHAVWHRVGRGRERQFYATDAEMVDLLNAGLPKSHGPYWLLGAEVTSSGLDRRLLVAEVDDVVSACARSGGHIVWLASTQLTDWSDWDGASLDSRAAINGLILIEHGYRHRGAQESSRIASVNRIRNVVTGELGVNAAYQTLYRSLDRAIRYRLAWTTVRALADGTTQEDATTALMTDRAAERAMEKPHLWAVRPGHRLQPRIRR